MTNHLADSRGVGRIEGSAETLSKNTFSKEFPQGPFVTRHLSPDEKFEHLRRVAPRLTGLSKNSAFGLYQEATPAALRYRKSFLWVRLQDLGFRYEAKAWRGAR